MERVRIEFEITPERAFEILLKTLHVSIKEDAEFVVEDGEIKVKDFDDRGELYLAIYHLATKMFPNTEFRHLYDDPNVLMAELYREVENDNKSE